MFGFHSITMGVYKSFDMAVVVGDNTMGRITRYTLCSRASRRNLLWEHSQDPNVMSIIIPGYSVERMELLSVNSFL